MPQLRSPSAFAQAAAQGRVPESESDGVESLTSSGRWRSAVGQINLANAVSRSFKTLRDMSGESYVEEKRLKKIKTLGSGSFATVELCKLEPYGGNNAHAVEVAVKRIHGHVMHQAQDLEAFVSEAKLLRKLQHKYIVRFMGVGGDVDVTTIGRSRGADSAAEAHTFIVQEFINGGTLGRQVMQKMTIPKTYSDADALTWMRQIAEALAYLHAAKPRVIHRDLKLENVLMRKMPDGRLQACLCDFGLSALVPAGDQDAQHRQLMDDAAKGAGTRDLQELANTLDKSLRRADTMALQRSDSAHEQQAAFDLTGRTGSFLYMAPEVVFALPYNEKADVFAFAQVMLEVFSAILTNAIAVAPTQHPKAAELYAFKVAEGYRRQIPKTVPGPLAELIQACWSEKAAARPTMLECVQRLRSFETSQMFGDNAMSEKTTQGCSCSIM